MPAAQVRTRSLGHRAPLLWLVLPLAAGLAAGRSGLNGLPVLCLAAALMAAVGAFRASVHSARLWGVWLVASMLLAGSAAYGLHRARLRDWESLPPREARLELRVDRTFDVAGSGRASGLATIVGTEPHLRDLTGQRLHYSLSLPRGSPAPIRSAVVSTIGVLSTLPEHPPTDTFDGYLAGAGINFRYGRGRVRAETKPPRAYYRACAWAAAQCSSILGRGIADKRPELAGLLRAMMLGSTHDLTDEQHALFMQSGTMHLFAISGLNIGVIAAALQTLLLLLRVPRWGRLVLGTTVLWLFVDLTGASPSAVRAFAMATFVQTALTWQRPGNLLASLTLSAFAVVVLAPFQFFSASFLMSYGIVAALLLIGVPLGEAWQDRIALWRSVPKVTWSLWQRLSADLWRRLAATLAIGLATTLVSLVTSVLFFRLLTPGALAANLIMIPAASLVTLGGFASLLCGAIGFDAGAVVCNHAAALLLFAIERLVRFSVQVPGASLPAHFTADWAGSVLLTLLMAALLAGYAVDWRRTFGGWWPPFAIVTLGLLLGVALG